MARDDPVPPADAVSRILTGGAGAGVVYSDGDVRFLQVRISVVGLVIPWGEPAFLSGVVG